MSTTAVVSIRSSATTSTARASWPLTAEQSIAQLEQDHGGPLRRYLARLTGDFQKAEDIYQETLIRAWKHPEQRDARGRYCARWLYTIARRISIDHLRADALRPALVSDDILAARHLSNAVADNTEQLLAARVLRDALAGLSAEHRQIIYEMYYLDRPATEVAARLGIPLGTVKSRTYCALRALRDKLATRGLDLAA